MRLLFTWFLVFAALLGYSPCFSNAAMPGFWENGNGAEFYPLFLEDSVHIGKIEMHSEEISVHIYPGYAVVKGVYYMLNTANEPVTLTTGYPINGSVSQKDVYAIHLSNLYSLRVLVNDSAVIANKIEGDNGLHSTEIFGHSDNWYVWKTTYAPGAITKLTVYYTVNTQNTVLREGYNTKKGNCFSYILESGRVWKDRIGTGVIRVWLKNGLKTSDVYGVMPYETFSGNDTVMVYRFENMEPMPADNIVIWYKALLENFDFDKTPPDADACYRALDVSSVLPGANASFKTITVKDFKTGGAGNVLVAALMFLVFFSPYIFIGLIILAVVIYFVRKRKKANQNL